MTSKGYYQIAKIMTNEEFEKLQWEYIEKKTRIQLMETAIQLAGREGEIRDRLAMAKPDLLFVEEAEFRLDYNDLFVLSMSTTSNGAFLISQMLRWAESNGGDFPMTIDQVNYSVNKMIGKGLMEMHAENAFPTEKGKALVEHVYVKSFRPVFGA